MKKRLSLLLIITISIIVSCNNKNDNSKTKDTAEIQLINTDGENISDSLSNDLNQFNIERIKEYDDTINSFFLRFDGLGKENYVFVEDIDTTITERYVSYDYNLSVPFRIFEFENNNEAVDFFNELITIDYLVPFGLNKRPNHIIVDSNKVYWISLNHQYSSHEELLLSIFREVFNFNPSAANLDSNVYRDYISWEVENTELTFLYGKWESVDYIVTDTIGCLTYPLFIDGESDFFVELDDVSLQIYEDMILFNQKIYSYGISQKRTFPDAKYYWEYLFYYYFFWGYENENRFTQELKDFIEKRSVNRMSIMDYNISLKRESHWSYISIINEVNKDEIYFIIGKRIFKMRRVD